MRTQPTVRHETGGADPGTIGGLAAASPNAETVFHSLTSEFIGYTDPWFTFTRTDLPIKFNPASRRRPGSARTTGECGTHVAARYWFASNQEGSTRGRGDRQL
jgi:hypothetical protein